MLNLTILITLTLGLMIFLKWYVKKEIFDPMFLVSAYWIVFILFSIMISIPLDLQFYWTGIFPLAILFIAFNAGSFVMKHLCNDVRIKKMNTDDDEPVAKVLSVVRLKWFIVIFSAIGLLAIYLQLSFLNIQIRNFSDLLHAATRISEIRYNGGLDVPKYSLFLMSFLYSSSFLGGICFVISRSFISKIVSFLPFLVIIIFTITNGVKAGFLFLSIIWASGYVSAYIYEHKGQIKNVKKLFTRMIIIFALVFCLIPLTQFFRGGKSNEKIKFISPGIISYFVSFNAFTLWYHSYNNDEVTGFKYSLSGAHNYFYGEREQGLYGKKYTSVGNYIDQPITTNVYTMARGMIEDFTIFGALLILFITGMIVHLLYILTKRKRILPMSLLALFFSILFCSFTQNIINYNTIFLSWVISFLIILWMGKKQITSSNQRAIN